MPTNARVGPIVPVAGQAGWDAQGRFAEGIVP
jgi:hypothetical protein